MKVCHISSVHPVRDIRIFHKECVSLAKAGFEVSLVVVGNEGVFVEKGVTIHTLNIKQGKRLGRIFSTSDRVSRYALSLNADVYHIHDAELLLYANRFLRNNKKLIYDVHEDLPLQIKSKHWIPAWFRSPLAVFVNWYEKRTASRMHGLVAATNPISAAFRNHVQRRVLVRNFPMLHEFEELDRSAEQAGLLCYLGSVSEVRGIKTLLESLNHCDARLVLAGSWSPPQLRDELCKHPAWSRVDEKGMVGRQEVIEILKSSSIGMVTLLPSINFIESLPIKMFEYMAAGIPVIASRFPLWEEIVEKAGCGICVNPSDPTAIAVAVQSLVNNPEMAARMGSQGRAAVFKNYNWQIEERKLVEFYHSIGKPEKS